MILCSHYIAVNHFLQGCRDRGAVYLAVQKKRDGLQTAVFMRRQ